MYLTGTPTNPPRVPLGDCKCKHPEATGDYKATAIGIGAAVAITFLTIKFLNKL